MYELFVLLRGICLGLLLALILSIVLRHRQNRSLVMLAWFALSLVGYLLAPLLYGKSPAFALVGFISDTAPLTFLLFVQALFDEHRMPAPASLATGAIYLALGYLASWNPSLLAMPGISHSALWLSSRALMIAMLIYALFRMLRHWQPDLVEQRRRLRLTVTVIAGCYILGVVVFESLSDGAVPLWVEVIHSAGMLLSTGLFLAVLISIGPGGMALASADPAEPPPTESVADDPELAGIIQAMELDHAYRDMDLTIRGLGERLAIPEHRLRRLINRQLGYRNFNDFLNHYRLQEVLALLDDAGNRRTPILSLAMEAGYRSMTTFNRAFKATVGMTPREYREKS